MFPQCYQSGSSSNLAVLASILNSGSPPPLSPHITMSFAKEHYPRTWRRGQYCLTSPKQKSLPFPVFSSSSKSQPLIIKIFFFFLCLHSNDYVQYDIEFSHLHIHASPTVFFINWIYSANIQLTLVLQFSKQLQNMAFVHTALDYYSSFVFYSIKGQLYSTSLIKYYITFC